MQLSTSRAELRIDNVRLDWVEDDTFNDAGEVQYGCRAIAEVSYPIDSAGARRLETLTSGGLYGIDLGTGATADAYKRQIETEQLEDLRDHLAVFGVPLRHLDPLADFIAKWQRG